MFFMLCFSSNDGVSWYLHPPVRGNRREKMLFVMMFHLISHCDWLEKIEKYAPPTTKCHRPVTIVHNWKSCPRCHFIFPHILPESNELRKTGANLFSLNTATLPVLLRYLSKDVWHGHRSLAQLVGISMFGWKESQRSVPLSIWKQRWPFAGCPTQSKQRRGIMICSSSWARGCRHEKLMRVSDVSCFVSSQWLGKMKKYMSLLFTIENHVPGATRCSFQKECEQELAFVDSKISALLEWHMVFSAHLTRDKPSPKNWSQSLHISTQRPFRGSCPAPE